MAKRIRFCPKCMNIIHKNDEKCSSCGLEVSKMQELKQEETNKYKNLINNKNNDEFSEVKSASELYGEIKVVTNPDNSDNLTEDVVNQQISLVQNSNANDDSGADLNAENPESRKVQSSIADDGINSTKNAQIGECEDVTLPESSESELKKEDVEKAVKPKRHKHKSKQIREEDLPEFSVDANGQYNINTKDVTFLEGIDYKAYSKKQARGEKPAREKIEWWEIYKWADLFLARRKINKEVKKASYKIPYGITKTGMLLWCIFFGWLGIHNFYAKNNKKGWTVVSFVAIVSLVINIPVLYEIMGIFVGGGLGFTIIAMWFLDLYGIITNRYQYRISKEEFISKMNTETRGKLAKKYWRLDRPAFLAKEQKRLDKIVAKRNKKNKQFKTENKVSDKNDRAEKFENSNKDAKKSDK